MKTAPQKLADQISKIERQIQERLDKAGEHRRQGSQNIALADIWLKKQLEELLAKRLNTQETLQTMLNKIESAATEVESLRHVCLNTPSCSTEAAATTRIYRRDYGTNGQHIRRPAEAEDAGSFGNDLAARSFGGPEVDGELKDELKMLINKRKKEEEAEKDCVTWEEKWKAEEKDRARVEAEKKRKAIEAGSHERWRRCYEKRYDEAQALRRQEIGKSS